MYLYKFSVKTFKINRFKIRLLIPNDLNWSSRFSQRKVLGEKIQNLLIHVRKFIFNKTSYSSLEICLQIVKINYCDSKTIKSI